MIFFVEIVGNSSIFSKISEMLLVVTFLILDIKKGCRMKPTAHEQEKCSLCFPPFPLGAALLKRPLSATRSSPKQPVGRGRRQQAGDYNPQKIAAADWRRSSPIDL